MDVKQTQELQETPVVLPPVKFLAIPGYSYQNESHSVLSDYLRPSFPILRHFPELAQVHVHCCYYYQQQ